MEKYNEMVSRGLDLNELNNMDLLNIGEINYYNLYDEDPEVFEDMEDNLGCINEVKEFLTERIKRMSAFIEEIGNLTGEIESDDRLKKIQKDWFNLIEFKMNLDALNKKFMKCKIELILKNVVTWYMKYGQDLEEFESLDDCIYHYFEFSGEEEIYQKIKSNLSSIEIEILNGNISENERMIYFILDGSKVKYESTLLHYFYSRFELDREMYLLYKDYSNENKKFERKLQEVYIELNDLLCATQLEESLIEEYDNLKKFMEPNEVIKRENLMKIKSSIQEFATDKETLDLLIDIEEYLEA